MNKIIKLSLIFAIAAFCGVNAQEKKTFKLHTVAFYNLENLFDTINDPNKNDEASPMMELRANRSEIYEKKVHNMARVLADIGKDLNNNTASIIGVCEIENREVLEDVTSDPLLLNEDYGIIHYNSPDARSIDVALLYKKSVFQPTATSSHELKIYNYGSTKRVYTRDQLLVTGMLEGEEVHFIVNHWPSRSGGEAKSRAKRVAAAKLNKTIIDSLQSINPYAKIITMGDLNDDPTNSSVKDVLEAERNKEKVKFKGIYNPYIDMFKKGGLGTTGYRDAWSLFDQMMLTKPFVENDFKTLQFYKAGIFNKHYLINSKGRYAGYPFRSFADGGFTGGFSDHFPVYVYLIKEVQ